MRYHLPYSIYSPFPSSPGTAKIDRSTRYKRPFTIAYINLDIFKTVNDSYGHSEGYRVLISIVQISMDLLRKTDTVVRIGGDEFAFLLSETDRIAAESVISRGHNKLSIKMKNESWPATFSIGFITFTHLPDSPDNAIILADELMYSVKNRGKNDIVLSAHYC